MSLQHSEHSPQARPGTIGIVSALSPAIGCLAFEENIPDRAAIRSDDRRGRSLAGSGQRALRTAIEFEPKSHVKTHRADILRLTSRS